MYFVIVIKYYPTLTYIPLLDDEGQLLIFEAHGQAVKAAMKSKLAQVYGFYVHNLFDRPLLRGD